MTVCVISLIFVVFLLEMQRDDLKAQAVKRGFAEWVVNEKGDTTFEWKDGAK
jgi:hypothetical protein